MFNIQKSPPLVTRSQPLFHFQCYESTGGGGGGGSPTPIPFEFSPGLGILALGAWGFIAYLNSLMQKRKALDVGSLKTNTGQAESV